MNVKAVRNLELKLIRNSKADFFHNLCLIEAMYKEAVLLGAFPPRDIVDGLDVDIKVARVINSVSKTS